MSEHRIRVFFWPKEYLNTDGAPETMFQIDDETAMGRKLSDGTSPPHDDSDDDDAVGLIAAMFLSPKSGSHGEGEPYAAIMHREQRQVAEIQRRGWSPCRMTTAMWAELADWSAKVD